MRHVVVGSSGTAVPAVGLGCMGLSWAYPDPTRKPTDHRALLHRAVDLGVGVFDTSDQYGPYVNEELLGDVFQDCRRRVFLCTKGGLVVQPDNRTVHNGTPEHLSGALTATLQRLRTDHVDLYQLHRVDPDVEIEHSWQAMAGFVEDGRARMIGLCEVTVEQIQRAQAVHPVATVQSELSLWSKDALRKAHLPPGDWRRGHPRFQEDALKANAHTVLRPLAACAQELGVTPAQVALAWVLAQGPHVVAVPGTQRTAYHEQNWRAGEVRLRQQWQERLDALPVAAGSRY